MDQMPHTLVLRDIGKCFIIHELLFHRRLSFHISGGGGGYPHPTEGGAPSFPMGVTPSQVRMGGTPILGQDMRGTPIQGQDRGYPGVPHPHPGQVPGQDKGGGVPPPGTAQHVLATRRAVCLLRSHRTFLS